MTNPLGNQRFAAATSRCIAWRRRHVELRSIKMLFSFSNILKHATSSSPHDAGVGRGPRRGAPNVPPLPGPLLHPMEERVYLQFPLGEPEASPPWRRRGFPALGST